jgi:hypothetical protein
VDRCDLSKDKERKFRDMTQRAKIQGFWELYKKRKNSGLTQATCEFFLKMPIFKKNSPERLGSPV